MMAIRGHGSLRDATLGDAKHTLERVQGASFVPARREHGGRAAS
jgi:hypothetical protein